MDIVTSGPLRVAGLRFHLPDGAPALTVVCKATFTLRPGESPLSPQQDAPAEDDTYWDDDPQRSLAAATDMVPFKARVDVLVVGYAFSRTPVRSVVARLSVGTVDKAIEVHTDRAIGPDGVLREGPPFTRMRLRWERAAGGPDTVNPVGMRFDQVDARGLVMVPNLQPLTATWERHGDTFEPIGFGPIAPLWPERLTRIHRSALGWSPYGWTEAPLPEALDPGYFNVAPADQQLDVLPNAVPLFLEHLHAEHDHLSTQLAEVAPRAVVERPDQPPQPLALLRDTLTIDTDRGVCHVVWRGTVRLAHPQEAGRVVVSVEEMARSWDPARPIDEGRQTLAPTTPKGSAAPAIPFSFDARRAAEQDDEDRITPRPPAPSALPFQRESFARDTVTPPPRAAVTTAPPPPAEPPPPPPPRAPLPSYSSLSSMEPEGTRVLTLGPNGLTSTRPGASGTPFAPPPPPRPSSPGLAVSPIAPPSLPAAPPPIALPKTAETSPWAAGASGVEPAAFTGSIGERIAVETAVSTPVPAPVSDDRRPRGEPELLGPLVEKPAPVTDAPVARAAFLASAARGGAVAASNAAADPPPPVPGRADPKPAKKRSAPEAVDLLWFDAESVARIRRRPPWRALLTDLLASKEVDAEEASLGNTPEEIEDRRDVLHVLVHGDAADHAGVVEALQKAVRADGKIIPPLVLAAGQLGFTFDELEMLKATLSAALPFAPGDEPLTAATATAKDFLATPGLLATGPVIESLTIRIREAFTRVKRAVPPEYLTVQGERALLEKRCYQKREVFSRTHLRGLLAAAGGEEAIPVYLPEEVSKKLPLYQRFPVRLIVEVHRTADQAETHPAALRVLAVGRCLSDAKAEKTDKAEKAPAKT